MPLLRSRRRSTSAACRISAPYSTLHIKPVRDPAQDVCGRLRPCSFGKSAAAQRAAGLDSPRAGGPCFEGHVRCSTRYASLFARFKFPVLRVGNLSQQMADSCDFGRPANALWGLKISLFPVDSLLCREIRGRAVRPRLGHSPAFSGALRALDWMRGVGEHAATANNPPPRGQVEPQRLDPPRSCHRTALSKVCSAEPVLQRFTVEARGPVMRTHDREQRTVAT